MRFHSEVLPLLDEAYIKTGKLYLVFKEYPVVNGDLSIAASLASECAASQKQFEVMHDWLFANVNEWRSAQDVIGLFKETARRTRSRRRHVRQVHG